MEENKVEYNPKEFSLQLIKDVFTDLFYKREEENKRRYANVDWTPTHYVWEDEDGKHSCWKIGPMMTNDAGYAQFNEALKNDIMNNTITQTGNDFEVAQGPTETISFTGYTEFVKSMKVYPEPHAIVYPTLGMCGEAGEVSEKVKKTLRGDKVLDKEQLALEVGDVLWYVTALADDLGYTLADIARMNVNKLTSRKERGVVKGDGDQR